MGDLRRILPAVSFVLLCACKKDPPAPPPIADFLVANNGCTAPCALYFYDHSENAVKWRWNFGNLASSDKQNDTITFGAGGTYEVSLKIWNADDEVDSVRKNVTLN